MALLIEDLFDLLTVGFLDFIDRAMASCEVYVHTSYNLYFQRQKLGVGRNGDILSFEDANEHFSNSQSAGLMIARGALIKPWIFTEIKEQRHWDISASERLDILRDFTNYGLENWGSDTQVGVHIILGILHELWSREVSSDMEVGVHFS
ncbi:tRNA-dihydrouridine(47) synthase [NAD(P)(+)]-like [Holothuria leucospilota]|uniref:tRNA-dihydrouridine(47) synthase [NAD(P)(+)] n=1 Tax=Holothuria leucospilota TaxID=206669 RepID=A0A9Q0YRE3_HOLLE|nr:tRNA-dihydrouridine(47) synthase [NAD(P)(+)]-like [Holothuria leucospilota]